MNRSLRAQRRSTPDPLQNTMAPRVAGEPERGVKSLEDHNFSGEAYALLEHYCSKGLCTVRFMGG
jgi:hypothetical protein